MANTANPATIRSRKVMIATIVPPIISPSPAPSMKAVYVSSISS